MKDLNEKSKNKLAVKTFKSTKKHHPAVYNNLRDELIKSIVANPVPNWGSAKFTITKKGV